MTKSHIGAVVP